MDDVTRASRRVVALAHEKFPAANDVRPVARSAGNGAIIIGAEVWQGKHARTWWPEGAVVA